MNCTKYVEMVRQSAMLNVKVTILKDLSNRSVDLVIKGNAIGARGLGFDFQVDQVGHSVATATTCFRSCVVQTLSRGDGFRHLFTLERNTASIIKMKVFCFTNCDDINCYKGF